MISRRSRPFTKTTKRNPNFDSYAPFSSASSASTAGSSSVPCSAADRAEVGVAADRRVRVEHLFLLGLCEAACDLARAAERIVERGQPFDESRAALEQLGELLDAQLPR